MARLDDASQRLSAALDRLEKALEAQAAPKGGDAEKLRSALDEAKRRNGELGDVADQVAQRLDRAAERISAILES